MTTDKKHVDLSKIEPIVRGKGPEDDNPRDNVDRVDGIAVAGPGATPAAGLLAETDDKPPPDPDDLDRLRRG